MEIPPFQGHPGGCPLDRTQHGQQPRCASKSGGTKAGEGRCKARWSAGRETWPTAAVSGVFARRQRAQEPGAQAGAGSQVTAGEELGSQHRKTHFNPPSFCFCHSKTLLTQVFKASPCCSRAVFSFHARMWLIIPQAAARRVPGAVGKLTESCSMG